MSRAEIEDLREQLSSLRIRVFSQEERIEALEKQLLEQSQESRGREEGGSGYPGPSVSVAQSEAGGVSRGSYSLVTSHQGQVGNSGDNTIAASDTAARLQLAEECGRFLRRALEGDFRGSSGRARLRLQSRVYVVAATFEGQVLDPVRVLHSFSEVRSLCKRGPSCGRAVFLGFATQWELRAALVAGEFTSGAEQ